jgi:hypothetical protein
LCAYTGSGWSGLDSNCKREVCLNISSGPHFHGGARSHTPGSSGVLRAVL